MPAGVGTWPALWMLGANYTEVGWPECGEIDIMEHWGHEPTNIAGSIHTPMSYGNTQTHGYTTIIKNSILTLLIGIKIEFNFL